MSLIIQNALFTINILSLIKDIVSCFLGYFACLSWTLNIQALKGVCFKGQTITVSENWSSSACPWFTSHIKKILTLGYWMFSEWILLILLSMSINPSYDYLPPKM